MKKISFLAYILVGVAIVGCSSTPSTENGNTLYKKPSKIARYPAESSTDSTIGLSNETQSPEQQIVIPANQSSIVDAPSATDDTLYYDEIDSDNGVLQTVTTGKYRYQFDNNGTVQDSESINREYQELTQQWLPLLAQHKFVEAFVLMVENRFNIPLANMVEHSNNIWLVIKNLNFVDENEIAKQLNPTDLNYLQMWIALRNVAYSGDFLGNIGIWQDRYPNNGISNSLLQELSNKYSFYIPINRVAVFIPLSGKFRRAGESIQEGIIEASNANNDNEIEINFYDSSDTENLQQNFDSEIASNVDFILGPVLKNTITFVETNGFDRHIVLNWLDYQRDSYQFGLGIESEVRQLLDWLKTDKKERIMIFSSKEDKELSNQIKEEWEVNASRSAKVYITSSIRNMRSFIEKIGGVSASKRRHRLVNSYLNIKSSAEYRTRKDNDAIISLLNLKQQKVLQPQLKFTSIPWPVYSTSELASNTKQQDLNGLRVLSPHYLYNTNFNKSKLYAFGWDAWQLVDTVSYLQSENPRDSVKGLSGELWLSEDGRVLQRLQPSIFRGSKMKPIY